MKPTDVVFSDWQPSIGDCGNCGKHVYFSDKFCSKCGTKIDWDEISVKEFSDMTLRERKEFENMFKNIAEEIRFTRKGKKRNFKCFLFTKKLFYWFESNGFIYKENKK